MKSGVDEVAAPVYSHLTYDVVPDETVVLRRPDVLIVEGLNVLQPGRTHADGRPTLAVSDFFDFSVYVDAAVQHIERWYVDRFLALRQTAFADPASYFHRFAALSDDEAVATATSIWHEVNLPNLVENIVPTRGRATLVLQKGEDHAVHAGPAPQALGRDATTVEESPTADSAGASLPSAPCGGSAPSRSRARCSDCWWAESVGGLR